MNFNFETMGKWERAKALFLLSTAEDLGMDITGYGEVSVNPHSGYTYLWIEDYNFSLYMPINCDLIRDDVYVLYTDYSNGDEYEIVLGDSDLDYITTFKPFFGEV